MRKKKVRKRASEGRKFVKRFHKFLDAWNAHVKEEVRIHKNLLYGKRTFLQHLKDAKGIHEKLLRDLNRL